MLARQMRELEDQIVANGRVEDHELRMLEQLLYADGKIDRKEANFLVEIHKRVTIRSPAFEKFFYKVLKNHVLANGSIGQGEVKWLRQLLLDDNRIDDEERELKGEASKFPKEFEELYNECMNMPQEQHTSSH